MTSNTDARALSQKTMLFGFQRMLPMSFMRFDIQSSALFLIYLNQVELLLYWSKLLRKEMFNSIFMIKTSSAAIRMVGYTGQRWMVVMTLQFCPHACTRSNFPSTNPCWHFPLTISGSSSIQLVKKHYHCPIGSTLYSSYARRYLAIFQS